MNGEISELLAYSSWKLAASKKVNIHVYFNAFFQVVILKSEYLNGMLRFVGNNHLTIDNPTEDEGRILALTLERIGGNHFPVTVHWKVMQKQPFIAPSKK